MPLNFLNNGYFAGSVGIGTNDPSRGVLQINGDFETTASGNGQLAVISKQLGSDPTASGVGGQMVFGGPISSTDSKRTFALVGGYKENGTSGDRAGYLSLGTRENTGARDIVERIRVTSVGDVGIGTDSPRSILNLARAGTDNYIKVEAGLTSGNYSGIMLTEAGIDFGWTLRMNAATDLLHISYQDNVPNFSNAVTFTRTGNVGIGTDSPDYDLDVERTATTINDDPTIGIRNAWGGQGNNTGFSNRADLLNSAGAGAVIVRTRARYDASANWGEIGTTTAHDFNIRTSGTHRITVLAGGNVGIGVTGPLDKLNVGEGNIRISQTDNVAAQLILNTYQSALGNATYKWFVEQTTSANSYSFQIGNGTTPYLHINSLLFGAAAGNVGIGTNIPGEKLHVNGNALITSALLSNQENTDVDTGTETVASVAIATYTAAFFDFVIKKGLNVRSGTVYACHDGDTTPLVQFTETSTQDLGDTSDVTLSVDILGTVMRLQATTTSDDWSIKSLIRAI